MKTEDKKEIMGIVCEALEQIVLPRFESIDNKFESIDNKFESIDSRLESIDSRLEDMEETQHYHSNQLETINRRLNNEMERNDEDGLKIENHEKRIKKLEATA